eukprot:UN22837
MNQAKIQNPPMVDITLSKNYENSNFFKVFKLFSIHKFCFEDKLGILLSFHKIFR